MKSPVIEISSDDESDITGGELDTGDVSPMRPEPENRLEWIVDHKIEDGKTYFLVHWEGYRKKDRTWEPEENLLEDAPEHVQAYWDSVYEPEEETYEVNWTRSGATGAVLKRQKLNSDIETAWSPPAGSWEDEIDRIDYCEEEGHKLIVGLIWKNGKKTQHETPVVYKKCPQKMLHFYERHVKIVPPPENPSPG